MTNLLSEFMSNDAARQKELWMARLAMMTSISIFIFWATASERRSYPWLIYGGYHIIKQKVFEGALLWVGYE